MLHSLLYVKENFNSFNLRSAIHSYNTRQSNMLHTDVTRLNKIQNSFKYNGFKFFNRLPPNSHNVSNVKFKRVLQEWLIRHAFYSIKELEVCKFDITFWMKDYVN